ncbi:hypothetical protein [Streptomyces sp. NBC_00019]|uniref:hypothetical protein n=1 Tax=Streptomyces sp. NBC_00019 TaxID=2975623 RepID=UPI00324B2D24
MRADFNTLIWDVQGSVEFDDLLRSFIEGRCDGIYLRVQRGVELDHLDFLTELPGLKYVEVNGAVRDDSRAFSLPDVVELVLLTRSRTPVPVTSSDTLESLGVDDRPGVLDLSGLTRLRALTLWSFTRPDLRFLSGVPNLEWLKLEGLGSAVDLRGMESCRSLIEAELLELQVESLEPLRPLQDLLRLWLIGPRETQISEPLSLADLSGLSALRELRIINSGAVQTAEPLLGMPALEDVRLRGTRVLDESLEALQALSQRARVVGPDE